MPAPTALVRRERRHQKQRERRQHQRRAEDSADTDFFAYLLGPGGRRGSPPPAPWSRAARCQRRRKIEPVTPFGYFQALAQMLQRVGEGLGADQDDDEGDQENGDSHESSAFSGVIVARVPCPADSFGERRARADAGEPQRQARVFAAPVVRIAEIDVLQRHAEAEVGDRKTVLHRLASPMGSSQGCRPRIPIAASPFGMLSALGQGAGNFSSWRLMFSGDCCGCGRRDSSRRVTVASRMPSASA